MARQRPTRLVMGLCIYQLEVNRCRNEEIIVKGNFGWAWPMWAGRPRIDCIVIREVQYQFEVNRCRNEEIIAGRPRIDRIVIIEVQYQFEVNRCRNEEIIVKAILGGCGVGYGAMHKKVQYQFEVNPCRNEKIIVNGIFWWAVAYVGGRPRIDPKVLTKVQYQFEVNPCRNEKIIVNGNFWRVWPMWAWGSPGLGMGPCMVEIDRIVIREVQYQFGVNRCRNKEVNFQGSSAFSVGGDSGQDGRTDRQTDGRTAEINTISPPFFQKAWG
ncbi:hypothetical protein DPMN_194354 [Dreissena polymorpha]|uniref:Uncharacterized protein n=1 Tax=Dreissena polymorpha TaxID=45954 RepID=A0A9D3Y580_DREPO|nr:hypothetical protein DPMN_194354 [Dreissena polymorpha]